MYNEYVNKSLKERDYISSAEEKGKEEGMEKGRKEEKIQIARSLLEDKESIEKIIKWTGLNRLEVEKLLS